MANPNQIALVENEIYGVREQFERVSVDRSINFEREAGFAMQIITSNDYLLGIAVNAKQSVINAVTNVSAIGISLNPAKKQAYLVPRDKKVCLDISYMGLMDLAMETGSIKWAQCAVVYANDTFALNGFDKPPLHQYDPFGKDRGAIVGVYAVVKTAEGEYLTHTTDIDSVYAIRARSESWKSGKSSPWKSDPVEMIRKTCIKQAYKYWPKTERLEQAIHHLNTEADEGIQLLNEPKPVCPPEVLDAWVNKAKACETEKSLRQVWREGAVAIHGYNDTRAYETFKGYVGERGEHLKRVVIEAPASVSAAQVDDDQAAEFQADFEEKMRREGEE